MPSATRTVCWGLLLGTLPLLAAPRGPLDPRGQVHIPIGIPNTLDTLKTFVEADGSFSPGFGTYGIYFWLYDVAQQKLFTPALEEVPSERGLSREGYLLPWVQWQAGQVSLRVELCEVTRPSPTGMVFVVGARLRLINHGPNTRALYLYVGLRPLGPAGGNVTNLVAALNRFYVNSDNAGEPHVALWANQVGTRAAALATDTIVDFALRGEMPPADNPRSGQTFSANGDCSGAIRYDVTIRPGQIINYGFICPVLPGRRAVGHQWDGVSPWAQFDLAKPNPPTGGIFQADPTRSYWAWIPVDTLFDEAAAYWGAAVGRVRLRLPEEQWSQSFYATLSHGGLCLNQGAPDVAVVNYNVFNRDGVYLANMLQKAGHFDLAQIAIDYFLKNPFNGRVQPEADNPGQILWILAEHWRFTRDKFWLDRVSPAAEQLAKLLEYCRTTPDPHWVSRQSLQFGEQVEDRQELKPGACDGFHPEYTEAFDIAGLRAAATLAQARADERAAAHWRMLADSAWQRYQENFGAHLDKDYGSYCVLWPCHLDSLERGPAHDVFLPKGPQVSRAWRYFPLATAHQSLLAGSREAGWVTISNHLAHPQMQSWFALDEGGPSGVGGWNHVRTTWPQGERSVAMPHGWAIAEYFLLLRDCLLFEEDRRAVLLAGVPPAWFTDPTGITIQDLPTHFGPCSLAWTNHTLNLSGSARPPDGWVLRPPPHLFGEVEADDKTIQPEANGDFLFPPATRHVRCVLMTSE